MTRYVLADLKGQLVMVVGKEDRMKEQGGVRVKGVGGGSSAQVK